MCYYLQHTFSIVLIDAVIFTDALLLFKSSQFLSLQSSQLVFVLLQGAD